MAIDPWPFRDTCFIQRQLVAMDRSRTMSIQLQLVEAPTESSAPSHIIIGLFRLKEGLGEGLSRKGQAKGRKAKQFVYRCFKQYGSIRKMRSERRKCGAVKGRVFSYCSRPATILLDLQIGMFCGLKSLVIFLTGAITA